MKNSSVDNCKLVSLNLEKKETYSLLKIDNKISVGFDVNRLYYLYNVPNKFIRGEHAHKELYQLIVGVNGGFKINLDDGKNKKTVILDDHTKGLLIVPGIWRTLTDFSPESICLVFASEFYSEMDYIRNYEEFLNYKK